MFVHFMSFIVYVCTALLPLGVINMQTDRVWKAEVDSEMKPLRQRRLQSDLRR